MASVTVENYVKTLYLQQQETGEGLVPMGQLAMAMAVAPGTATAMVKTLEKAGLVRYEPRDGVRLSQGGEQLALHVLRRHRLIELYLVNVLGLDWSEVHEEAEQLEHAVSDRVLDRIDEALNHPRVDPHGDPIPTAKGALPQESLISLATTPSEDHVVVARIIDQHPEFLQFVRRVGLTPGASLTRIQRDEMADAITVSLADGHHVTLGQAAAEKILVTTAEN